MYIDTNNEHIRKRNRLKDYDYSNEGFYFVTICTKDKINYFGEINDGKIILNEIGQLVEKTWNDIETIYNGVKLDYSVVMPNHIHGIVYIKENCSLKQGEYGQLSKVIKSFKSIITKSLKKDKEIWQRSFYDRVIRNENELYKIRKYIENNPLSWHLDKYNSQNEKISKILSNFQ